LSITGPPGRLFGAEGIAESAHQGLKKILAMISSSCKRFSKVEDTMRKLLGSVLFLLLLVLFCDGTPLIHFKEVVWDFGTVPQMQAVKHVFEFSNDGEATLYIKDIKAD
jgi:hypothetical protein